jgi:hypothetical protein
VHTLIALIVKAATQTEAEQKAWASLANYICVGDMNPNDFGIVVGSKIDLVRKYPDTYRWKCLDPTNPAYKKTEHIKTIRVDSEYRQKFIRSRYPPPGEQPTDQIDSYLINLGNSGYYVRDEEGNYISDQNDIRLKSSEYFVVPVDVHS